MSSTINLEFKSIDVKIKKETQLDIYEVLQNENCVYF